MTKKSHKNEDKKNLCTIAQKIAIVVPMWKKKEWRFAASSACKYKNKQIELYSQILIYVLPYVRTFDLCTIIFLNILLLYLRTQIWFTYFVLRTQIQYTYFEYVKQSM
jgi:hypothetical protein